MKNFLAVLAILSFSVSAETILVGKPDTDYLIQKDRIGSLEKFESIGDIAYRYQGATTHLHVAEFGVSDKGMLVLKRLILNSHFDGLERGTRVKNDAIKVGPLKSDAVDKTVWGTSKYEKAFIYVNLMKQLEIASINELSGDAEKISAALKSKLMPEKLDVAQVDAMFEYRIDNKGNDDVRQALIAARVVDVQKLLNMAIPAMTKEVASKSLYAALPSFVKDGFEFRSTRLEGESYSQLVEKGAEVSDIAPALRGLKYQRSAVALSEKDATKWLQSYLTSQLAQFPKGGYSKGGEGEIVYNASDTEQAALAKFLGVEEQMGSVSYEIAKLEVSFQTKVVGDVTNQYVLVKLPLKVGQNENEISVRYRITSNSLVIVGEAPKFLARDMKNMLLQSFVPRSMTEDIGKTEGGFSIGLSGAQDENDPFGDESTGGGYLVIKK